jgi:hypothetical protein
MAANIRLISSIVNDSYSYKNSKGQGAGQVCLLVLKQKNISIQNSVLTVALIPAFTQI